MLAVIWNGKNQQGYKMALTDLILKQGQIIVMQNDISSAGVNTDIQPLLFGEVTRVSDLSLFYEAGNYVIFNPGGATKFTISGVNFFLTTEDKIYLKQPSIAP